MSVSRRANVEVVIHRSSAIHDEDLPVVRVLAATPMPENQSLECSRQIYKDEARALASAMFDHLPGGTMDQLLIELLRRRAALLVVAHGAPHETPHGAQR